MLGGSSTGGLKGMGALMDGVGIGARSGEGMSIGRLETDSFPGAIGLGLGLGAVSLGTISAGLG